MIGTIAVVGAGVMGADTAFDIASRGYQVILKDVCPTQLAEARTRIKQTFRTVHMIDSTRRDLSEEMILSRIEFTLEYADFETAELILENITENWSDKEAEYRRLREVCAREAIFAANTSCIPIRKIASLVVDPQRAIGVHFMNPVPLIKLVEVIRGARTSPETETTVLAFLESLGKVPVVVNDSPGFVSNRVSHLFMNEAAFLVQEKVAEPRDIDDIFTQGYGHKLGPLATIDLIGVDTVVNSLDILYEELKDPKFRCCPLLRSMLEAGLLGRKSGQGFYQY